MAETPKFYIQWTIGRKVPNRNVSNDYGVGSKEQYQYGAS